MQNIKNYFSLFRLLNVLLLALGITFYLTLTFFWSDICVAYQCSSYTMSGYLAPLREAGLVLAAVVSIFLFLPTLYFRKWLIWIGLPLAIYSFVAVVAIDPNSSNMFNSTREDVVKNFLNRWLVVTFVFIAIYWYRTRNKKS